MDLSGVAERIFTTAVRQNDSAAATAELDAFCRRHLGRAVDAIVWQRGRIGVAYCLRLDDGTSIVLKARPPSSSIERGLAVTQLQRRLADHGLPYARPLLDPLPLDAGWATAETLIDTGSSSHADPRHAVPLRSSAQALVQTVDALAGEPVPPVLLATPSAWHDADVSAREGRLWPVPHDVSLFGAAFRPRQPEIAALASAAAERRASGPPCLAHLDWEAQNLGFDELGRVTAVFDADSLGAATEEAVAGTAAGSYTAGSAGHVAPSPADVTAFLDAYDAAGRRGWTADQRAGAAAAAAWLIAYNAGCDDVLGTRATGGYLDRLMAHGDAYLSC